MWQHTDCVLDQNIPGVTTTEKFLLAVISHSQGKNGEPTWPSNETLAARIQVTQRHIRKLLAHLEEIGLLVKAESDGLRSYQVQIKPVSKAGTRSPRTTPPVAQDRNPVAQDRNPVAQDRNPVAQDHPYKEEGYIEGNIEGAFKGESQSAAPSKPPFALAQQILNGVRLPAAVETLKAATLAIECEVRAGISPEEAVALIIEGCQEARNSGEVINKYAFIDARYRPENRRKQPQTFSQMQRIEHIENHYAAIELYKQRQQRRAAAVAI